MNRRHTWLAGVLVTVVSCAPPAPGLDGAAPSPPHAPATDPPVSSVSTTPAVSDSNGDDPALAGVAGIRRLAGDLEVAAAERNLLDPEGHYMGPTDPDGGILLLEPIEGYGDFSDWTIQQRWDADRRDIDDLIFRCLSDLDPRFADHVEQTGEFNWSAFPGQLEQVAFAAYLACTEGLHLPRLTRDEWTDAMWEEAYAYHMAWIDCLERETGINSGPRIDYDTWRRQGTAYDLPPDHPFNTLDAATLQRLERICPASPPGGYANWNPGDPVGTP